MIRKVKNQIKLFNTELFSMKKPCPFLLFLLTLIVNPVYLHAQQSSDTLSVILEPIKVEATHSSITIDRATMSLSTLQRSMDDMAARRASTMDELTFTLPGVWISNRENHALGERMTIRGMGWRSQFGVRGVQIILDGIPLTVADGQTIMNMVDPAMVQSLELLRGPSATFWGNSSGGVLFMRTRPPADAPNFMFRTYAGSFNTMKQEARWHDQIGGVRWNAYGSYYQTDGFRDYSAAQLIRGGISAGFDVNENSTFEARIAYSGMPDAQHPGSLSSEDAENEPTMAWPFNVNTRSGKQFHQLMGSGEYLHDFSSGLLTFSAHGTYRDLVNPLPGPYITVNRLAGGTRATYDIESLPFQLQVGGEMKWQRDERDQTNNEEGNPGENFIISQLDNVRNQALFFKGAVDLSRVTLSLGLRADRMVFKSDSIDTATGQIIEYENERRVFNTLNPSIGINYNLHNARLFANFSTSFESPTTTEFKNRLGMDGNIQPGFNPNLNPEKTIGLETGIRGIFQGISLEYDIALFGLYVRDQIIQENEIDGLAIFSNGGNAEHYGLETHIKLQPANFLSLELMHTWVNATFAGAEFELEEDYLGNKLPGVAPHRFGSIVTFRPGNHMISTDVEWVGEYFADSANTARNDSYFLLNGRWLFDGLGFDGWKLQPFFSVYNILNTRYNTSVAINNNFGRYFEPGSSRNFQGGVSVQF